CGGSSEPGVYASLIIKTVSPSMRSFSPICRSWLLHAEEIHRQRHQRVFQQLYESASATEFPRRGGSAQRFRPGPSSSPGVNMFRHDDVAVDTQPVSAPHPLQSILESAARQLRDQRLAAAIAAEGDEVRLPGLVEALESPRHAASLAR